MSEMNCKKFANVLMHPETVMPKMPDLVMAREKKGAKEEGDADMGQCVPPPEHPEGSEYLASGQRRAWGLNQPRFDGLPPTTNGRRGAKKGRKKGKHPSTSGNHGRRHAQAKGGPSRNGVHPG